MTHSKKNRLWLRILLTSLCVLAIALIFFQSSLDADTSETESGFFLDSINALLRSWHIPLTVTELFVRKSAHFFEYAALGTLLFFTVHSYVENMRIMIPISLSISLVVAVIDEWIQTFPIGRSCELLDMALDFSGALCAILLCVLIQTAHRKRQEKRNERDDDS